MRRLLGFRAVVWAVVVALNTPLWREVWATKGYPFTTKNGTL